MCLSWLEAVRCFANRKDLQTASLALCFELPMNSMGNNKNMRHPAVGVQGHECWKVSHDPELHELLCVPQGACLEKMGSGG